MDNIFFRFMHQRFIFILTKQSISKKLFRSQIKNNRNCLKYSFLSTLTNKINLKNYFGFYFSIDAYSIGLSAKMRCMYQLAMTELMYATLPHVSLAK